MGKLAFDKEIMQKKNTNGEEILVQNTNFEIPFTSFLG